jgi:hypothetical protein
MRDMIVMKELFIQFIVSHVVPVLVIVAWFAVFTILSTVLSHRVLIEGWIQSNPKLALTLRIFQKLGIDVWGLIEAYKEYAESRATLGVQKRSSSTLLGSMVVVLAFTALGCSHESARNRRLATQHDGARMATPAKVRDDGQCQFFDRIHVYGDWSAGVLGAVGTGAGIVASQTDDGARKAAIATGIGAAALGAVAVGVATKSSDVWTERCGQ